MSDQIVIPRSPEDLTADWLQTTLTAAGIDAGVASVSTHPVGTGQMASSIRMTIDYVGSVGDDAPASVVVKLAADDPDSRSAGANGAYLREVRFYQQLSATLPVATPWAYWAGIDVETASFAIVLQDLHPAVQGDQITGCTAADAESAAINIAGLHAPRWQDPTLFELDWLTGGLDRPQAFEALHLILAELTPGFVHRYRPQLDDRKVDLLDWFATHARDWLDYKPELFGLTHADHRLDNLLFDRELDSVTAVDWQTIGIRNPVADISYLLGTGLDPAERRRHEHEIVAGYHARLTELGVHNYDLDQCFTDYRVQSLHALVLIVLGSMLTGQTERGNAMFMAMLDRSSAQIDDLQSRDLIE